MERTELRSAFFAEVRSDPYAAILTKMLTQMWAEGYQQAAKDVRANPDDPDMLDRCSHGELQERAAEWLTDTRRVAEANMVIAIATMGPMFGGLHKP